MSEKTTVDFNNNEWSSIIRNGHWNRSYDTCKTKELLEAKTLADILFSSYETSIAGGLIIKFGLEDFLIENGFEIDRVLELAHDGEYIPTYKNVEYLPKQYKSCLHAGAFLFRKNKHTYLCFLENGSDFTNVKIASLKTSNPDSKVILDDLLAYVDSHNFLRGKKIDADANFITFDRPFTWEDLVLSDKVKVEIRQNLSNLIDRRDVYQKNNLVVKRGLIFQGPPGTGKSLLGKILCNTVDWTFVWVTPKYLQRSRDVSQIVRNCRDLTPVILFLEDIDLYGKSRSENGDPTLLGELMNQLDGIQENKDIITIATTNDAQALEQALDRPGRFDKILTFDKPTQACRIQMLKLFTKALNLNSNINWDKLAELTNGLTGAHIKEFINFVILLAVDDNSMDENQKLILKKQHFIQALDAVKKKDFSKQSSVGFSSVSSIDDWDIPTTHSF